MAKEKVPTEKPSLHLFLPESVVPQERALKTAELWAQLPKLQISDTSRQKWPHLQRIFNHQTAIDITGGQRTEYVMHLAQDVGMEIRQAMENIDDDQYINGLYDAIMTNGETLIERYMQSVNDLELLRVALGIMDEYIGNIAARMEERRRKQSKVRNMRAYKAWVEAFKIASRNRRGSMFFSILADPQAQLFPFLVREEFKEGTYEIEKGFYIGTEIFESKSLQDRGKGKYAVISIIQKLQCLEGAVEISFQSSDLQRRMEEASMLFITADWCVAKTVSIIPEGDFKPIAATRQAKLKSIVQAISTCNFRQDINAPIPETPYTTS